MAPIFIKRYGKIKGSTNLYGFRINKNASSPSEMITYMEDNRNYLPVKMNFSTGVFDYGSWANAHFMDVKPCILNYDGTVNCYLNPLNYAVANGRAVKIDKSIAGNVMVEFPKTYYKIVDNGDGTEDVYLSNAKIDEDFVHWSFEDCNGNEIPCCYMPAYAGASDGSRIRSVSGIAPSTTITTANMYACSLNNNPDSENIWSMETYADRMLIILLLLLIGKSTDTQAVFGNGYHGSSIASSGTLNTKGLFFGSNGTTSAVKVFGMEGIWGNIFRVVAGCNLVKGRVKVKLTHGTGDGSGTVGYNQNGDGYIDINGSYSGNYSGRISNINFQNNYFFVNETESGLAANPGNYAVKFCDYLFTPSSFANRTCYFAFGANYNMYYYYDGALCMKFGYDGQTSPLKQGSSICCKPLKKTA